ncbi:MAG: hypothetical protein JW958_02840 [Candidatus Eisenbacteria bacterium]|nr:hypothetical protein [Candidatus Eisenbacteria bacterium]
MRPTLFSLVALLFLSSAAFGEEPYRLRSEEIFSPLDGDARDGLCQTQFYDLCSDRTWSWTGWSPRDVVGVILDLPADCGKIPGASCTCTDMWWYWRHTTPNRSQYDISFRVYELDENDCILNPPLLTMNVDPGEGWNHLDELGEFDADRIVLAACFINALGPYLTTDNTYENILAGCGSGPTVPRSFNFGNLQEGLYCPPVAITDPAGPCNILMKANFDCVQTSVPDASISWGDVKRLFK